MRQSRRRWLLKLLLLLLLLVLAVTEFWPWHAGLDWGVWGAGLAATISQWASSLLLISLLFRRKLLQAAQLLQPPQAHEVVPYIWKGLVLALRMVITFGERSVQCNRSV